MERLGIKSLPGKEYPVVGFNGAPSMAQAVELDMIFLKKAYRGRYPLIDADHGIWGRDVLSCLVLLLDGPRQRWSEFPT